MADELKDQRVVTMMSPSELEAIDDWMFKNRIRSRGEAIRRLCQMAIAVDNKADRLWRQIMAVLRKRSEESQFFMDITDAENRDDIPAIEFALQGMRAATNAVSEHALLAESFADLLLPLQTMKSTEAIDAALTLAKEAGSDVEKLETALEKLQGPSRQPLGLRLRNNKPE